MSYLACAVVYNEFNSGKSLPQIPVRPIRFSTSGRPFLFSGGVCIRSAGRITSIRGNRLTKFNGVGRPILIASNWYVMLPKEYKVARGKPLCRNLLQPAVHCRVTEFWTLIVWTPEGFGTLRAIRAACGADSNSPRSTTRSGEQFMVV